MAKTRHYGARISQRGIRESTVELARQHGTPCGDKLVLGRKELLALLKELDRMRKETTRAIDKGGVIAIESGDVLISAFDYDSFNRY